MSALEIGQKLVNYCKEGRNADAISELYADDIVSIEAAKGGDFDQTITGKENVIKKNQWWYENHEVHGGDVEGPFPHGDRFATVFKYDVTFKPTMQRMKMDEVALFTVKDGKITKEEFFYHMG